MEGPKYNARNPAVKRIMQEMRELQQHPDSNIMAEALEDNIFEWHFVVRGAPETDFADGLYHGRILLPSEYPFKPPSFIMLTASGRFETGVKVCLSMSSHHPEHWQPSWSVRTALVALIAFMPTPGKGAIGSVDFPSADRRALAAASRHAAPKHGSAARQAVSQRLHNAMLAAEASGTAAAPATEAELPGAAASAGTSAGGLPAAPEPDQAAGVTATPANQAAATAVPDAPSTPSLQPASATSRQPQPPARLQHQQGTGAHAVAVRAQQPWNWEDLGLTLLAGGLAVAIVAIVLRKVVQFTGMGAAGDMAFDLDSWQ